MVNKRFNKKFRRALGAALGALSVASISNIETIGAAFTETSLAADAQIGDIFKMSKDDKKRIVNEIENNLMTQIKCGDWKSGILGPKDLGGMHLNDVTLSYPIKYYGFGNWDYAWNVTIKWGAHPSVRITIIKTKGGLDGGVDYLIIPAVNDNEWKNRDEYNKYIRTHDVPWIGNWIKEGQPRPNARTVYLQTHDMFGPADKPNPEFTMRGGYNTSRAFLLNVPIINNKPFGAPAGWADATMLTRWGTEGLMDVFIWNKILGDDANIYNMYYDIKRCPPELKDFYYPPEKKYTYIDSAPAPAPVTPSTMNITPMLMTAVATTAGLSMTPQSTPVSATTAGGGSVTAASNNVGAAPVANGSSTTGFTDPGTATHAGPDVKLTNVQYDVKPTINSKENAKVVKS